MNLSKQRMATRHKPDSGREMNSHQRAALITLFLWQGSQLSTKDIARLCGMTTQGAGKMMAILSATLPIIVTDGLWGWMEKE